jgi:glycosyltransferase involved in cell wall biosynthesis
MTKPLCIIQAPYATRSGYGQMSADICRHIINLDRYDVKLISLPWGACPMNALHSDNPKDLPLFEHTVQPPLQIPRQPELFIQISVPNEFQPVAKYNIGITAGIETDRISPQWIEGCNRMDLILTISEHSKRVILDTVVEQKDQTGKVLNVLKVTKPVEVLHNCVDTNIFKYIGLTELSENIRERVKTIKEEFCFLFVGHWLKGNVGEDRKNVGMLIKIFCETFKGPESYARPALILKTSGATFSYMDQEEIMNKIRQIRDSVGEGCPNVYLLHGELTDEEMNDLYNHPKIKAHVSFTKGEGFGRPLLEATQSGKPIIASGWSGHLDFLNPEEAVLVGGELKQVEPGAVWEGVILPDAKWFNIDVQQSSHALQYAVKKYGNLVDKARLLAKKNAQQFNFDVIQERTKQLIDQYVPRFAMPVPLKLPVLKKVGTKE